MNRHLFALIVGFSSLGWFSADAQHPERQPAPQQKERPPQRSRNPAASAPLLDAPRSWSATRIVYQRRGAYGTTTLKPKDACIFVVIEVAARKGDFVKADLVMTMDAAGNWGPPAGIIFSGDEGGVLKSSEAVLADLAGGQYLPVLAAIRGFGYVERRDGTAAFGGMSDLTDTEAPKGAEAPASGRVVLVYEVPAGRGGFRLKVAESEPIAIDVKANQ